MSLFIAYFLSWPERFSMYIHIPYQLKKITKELASWKSDCSQDGWSNVFKEATETGLAPPVIHSWRTPPLPGWQAAPTLHRRAAAGAGTLTWAREEVRTGQPTWTRQQSRGSGHTPTGRPRGWCSGIWQARQSSGLCWASQIPSYQMIPHSCFRAEGELAKEEP